MEKIVTIMSFMELSKATLNFSLDNEMGNGMLGKVYKALVPNGWTVAIKRFQSSDNLEEEFVSEITTLGSLRHPNLVPLICFCSERDKRLLVYKYMPNMVLQLLELASDCMKFIPDQRPTMQQVYQTVAAIAQVHDQTGDPEIKLHLD
ncbi:hypothetical protein RDI58_024694 [Solanum bulbocastanum]|uniref:Protein kinase domain-containing protein n=1 Tax=Solanum bulbocastanum TaxID=147425 RepID=A0AAN8T3Q7_SOLBU